MTASSRPTAADLIRAGNIGLSLHGWMESMPDADAALADLLDALRLEHSSEAEHARMRLEAAIERTT